MWWCPTCHADVSGSQVTYEEYHEVCGTYLGDVQELNYEERIDSAIKFLYEMDLSPETYEERYYQLKGEEPIE